MVDKRKVGGAIKRLKFGLCIPTYGNSAGRLQKMLQSIKDFTKGIDYEIFVRDDATKNMEHVAAQRFVCERYGVNYEHGEEWNLLAGNFHALGYTALKAGCDVIVFPADDLLMSKSWLRPIEFFYEYNWNLPVGMVSGVFVEAWELAMNNIIPSEDAMYQWDNHGDVMREQLDFSLARYSEARAAGRIHLDGYGGILGVNPDTGKYALPHPVPLDGGLGPCFSIRADVFELVGGFDKCDFFGDFECMLGWKVWEAGFYCAMIPAPPVYHARGLGTTERVHGGMSDEEWKEHQMWSPAATKKFQERWPFESFSVAQQYFIKEYVQPAEVKLRESHFIRPLNGMTFPVNLEYDSLAEINQGANIHWRDERQQKRLKWIADHVLAYPLDMCCATAGLLEYWHAEDEDGHITDDLYTGIDFDRVRIEEAKSKYPEAEFFVMDVTFGTPFSDEHFPTVVLGDCLEHMPVSIANRVIDEAIRLAGNRVIITLPRGDAVGPNEDHVWDPSVAGVQDMLKRFEEEWSVSIEETEDFLLICVDRKPLVVSLAEK